MKIAVLAWGSLISDRRDLAIESSFQPIGSNLPIEFGRISGDGRLTLAIDEAVGANCLTYAAQSPIEYLDETLKNLWRREGFDDERAPAALAHLAGLTIPVPGVALDHICNAPAETRTLIRGGQRALAARRRLRCQCPR